MPRQFCHFLLTRFNVRLAPDSPLPSDEWLAERWDIFRRFTLPSVLGQGVPPDDWLVFCDAGSPEWFRAAMESELQSHGFHPVWLEALFSPDTVSEVVADRVPRKAASLITTRLDNDDALARECVAKVQAQFADQEREVINFTYGLQLGGNRVFHRADPANAFASLIERRSSRRPQTVFVDQHQRLGRYAPLTQVKARPMWLQVVHGGNVANEVRGVRANPAVVYERFDVRIELASLSATALRLDQLRTGGRLLLRVLRRPHRLVWLWRVVRARFTVTWAVAGEQGRAATKARKRRC